MKDLLKNSGLLLLGALLLILLVTNGISTCTEKKAEATITTAEAANDKNKALNALKLKLNAEKEQALDSQIVKSDNKIAYLQKSVDKGKVETNNLKKQNNVLLDSLEKNRTLENCEKVVEKQKDIIKEQDSTIIDQDKENEEYSHKNYLLTQKIAVKDSSIMILKNTNVQDSIMIDTYKKQAKKLDRKNKFEKFVDRVIIVALTVGIILK